MLTGEYEPFDHPVTFAVVNDGGCIVRDELIPDSSSRRVGTIPNGSRFKAVGRLLLFKTSVGFILRLKLKAPKGWVSQKSIGPNWGSMLFSKPLASDGEYDGMGLLEFCPFCLSSGVQPVLSARTSCDGCGKRGDCSALIGCRVCNWDICGTCRDFLKAATDSHDAAITSYSPASSLSPYGTDQFARCESGASGEAVAGLAVAGLVIGVGALFLSGSRAKTSTSYMKYSNDFELVVRATKDLGCLLEQRLGASRGAPLSAQIDFCSQNYSLSKSTIHKMKALVEVRNKLVHDYSFNQLGESGRSEFARTIDAVVEDLKEHFGDSSIRRRPDQDECTVM